jgi:hypothetical protein
MVAVIAARTTVSGVRARSKNSAIVGYFTARAVHSVPRGSWSRATLHSSKDAGGRRRNAAAYGSGHRRGETGVVTAHGRAAVRY